MRIKLTGGREGQTVTLSGVAFREGRATLRGSLEDRGKVFKFLHKMYQVEVDHGDGEVHPEAGGRPSGEVPGDVPEVERGAPEVPADGRTGAAGAETGTAQLDPERYRQENARILSAVKVLDPGNEEHWTALGLPRVDVVAQISGIPHLTRKMLDDVAPDIKRGG